jgi:DNA-binding CsgD family transcriptional regulator
VGSASRRSPLQREEASQPPRQTLWVALYEAVHALQAQGFPVAAIARQLGIRRPTVYVYLRRNTAPGPKPPQWRPAAQVLTPYIPYLIRRWHKRGTHTDSVQLWREIQALGYTHSARTVCRFITRLRRAAEVGQAPRHRPRHTSVRRDRPHMRCRLR